MRTQELQLGRDNAGRSGPFELPLTPPSPFKALYASINLERCEAGGFWPKFGGSAPISDLLTRRPCSCVVLRPGR